ncbi:GNAT family N-acetyltransferase [Atopomonas sediminilitoris]|uniref:GNAT family N-acetyltransferase n=1 Tax=Atopomonas sediminilitoris TaxID=2919919 RepID=UPI001F4E75F2|nr:GNAT family N-acetyltransferase [Atopomonas sediminilitoris]MCJ8170307.1 antimicrobial resistance protein Mig-14 [Atopomonas sediminilitoris]
MSWLNRVPAWREQGWQPITAAQYAEAYARFGGSVITHPLVVAELSALAGITPRYLGCWQGDELVGALATWGRFLACAKEALKAFGHKGLFDLGNAEFILPIKPAANVPVRFQARYMSALNQAQVSTLQPQAEELAMARAPEDYGKKFRYNQRRELRLLEEAGGVLRPVGDYAPQDLAAIYCDLFERRWGFVATGAPHMAQVLKRLHTLLTGFVLELDGEPIAVQLLYQAESPAWWSVEYVNGGVDPSARDFSPGSVLSFVNTQAAWEQARAAAKPLRYSFGRADREYKERWCHRVPVFQV